MNNCILPLLVTDFVENSLKVTRVKLSHFCSSHIMNSYCLSIPEQTKQNLIYLAMHVKSVLCGAILCLSLEIMALDQ